MVQSASVSLDLTPIPYEPRGAGRYAIEVTNALAKLDFEEKIELILKRRDRRFDDGRNKFILRNIAPEKNYLRVLFQLSVLPKILERSQVALYHNLHYMSLRSSKFKQVVTVHDMTFFDHPEWHESIKVHFFKNAIRNSIKRATAIICVSEKTRNALLNRFDPKCDLYVINHGVNREIFSEKGVEDYKILRKFDVKKPYIAFVGTLEPRKNLNRLVRAYEIFRKKSGKDIDLLIIGKQGWGNIEIPSDRARCLGFVKDNELGALYRNSSCVVYPAMEEGFGLPVLEALSCGAKVVTSLGTPMADLVGDLAYLVDPYDIKAISEGIGKAVFESGNLRDKLEKRDALLRRYTWEASAIKHLEIYRKYI